MHSLLYFTILYPKHKHLVENEFPQDTKTLAPTSNSTRVFSKCLLILISRPKLKVLSQL